MSLLIATIATQLVIQSASGLSVDQRITQLADVQANGVWLYSRSLYEDVAVRAEMRRVGFRQGCILVRDTEAAVAAKNHATLAIAYAAAIRKVVPIYHLERLQTLSFLVGPLSMYYGRVQSDVRLNGGPTVQLALDEARKAFFDHAKVLPSAAPSASVIQPKADIARSLGVRGPWNLDDPNHVAMACSEQLISPSLRPKISGGS